MTPPSSPCSPCGSRLPSTPRSSQALREQAATLAAEDATRAVEAARAIKTEDIDDETAEMMSAVFECDR